MNMATLVLEIQDRKPKFFKDIIQHFSLVTIQESDSDEDTDEQVRASIRQGVKEMRLVEQGKMKSTSSNVFLKELDEL